MFGRVDNVLTVAREVAVKYKYGYETVRVALRWRVPRERDRRVVEGMMLLLVCRRHVLEI